ncbi:hypothetical protein D7030_01280 [Flavobacteriaceae bacterium AU392]|nr:hypothetical protein D1817_07735 [Flavobacteriaceae bacterium]RKM86511.1 hypothetical protein D7030_01280 [Flavobacteriaceae bacterium AU392]
MSQIRKNTKQKLTINMKQLLTIALLFISLNCISQSNDFIGKWVGEDKGEVGYMNFDKEGFITCEFDGQTIGGKEFIMSNQKASMVYEINTNANPVKVDFIITFKVNGAKQKLMFIAKFKDKNTLVMASGFNSGVRPTEFTDDNSIVLTRTE